MTGVPPGTVTLTFTGEGVSASLTLNNVNAGDEIRIEVTSERHQRPHRI